MVCPLVLCVISISAQLKRERDGEAHVGKIYGLESHGRGRAVLLTEYCLEITDLATLTAREIGTFGLAMCAEKNGNGFR